MSSYVIDPPSIAFIPVEGEDARFPVRRIYCVGRNYLAHVREMNEGADERDPPFFFQKPRDSIVLDGGAVPYPTLTKSLHHEVELVVAIAKAGSNIKQVDALDHVYGYGVGIDVTRRDLQTIAKDKGWPWEMGKSFDHSAPFGALAPSSRVGHRDDLVISLSVNGRPRQSSTVAHMTWSVPEIISKLSEHYRLEPGDVIMTGTPEGVGEVVAGDVLEASVEGLPKLKITITEPVAP
ncbi:MAG: fumarylacetoacetate hydrolase family protein [Beijerinckiaceae bacterium]|nr:fumarylacetoacetate hydrolase family protein [Beijerinckiaceae bacterium]